jgi:transcriptional regulator with XRE-family HTH domain
MKYLTFYQASVRIPTVAPKRTKFSDQVRRAIEASGLTRYRIWQETGIDQATLSKFANRTAGLSMSALDKLAELLDLNVTAGKQPAKSIGKHKGR